MQRTAILTHTISTLWYHIFWSNVSLLNSHETFKGFLFKWCEGYAWMWGLWCWRPGIYVQCSLHRLGIWIHRWNNATPSLAVHSKFVNFLLFRPCGVTVLRVWSQNVKGSFQKLNAVAKEIFVNVTDVITLTLKFHMLDYIVKENSRFRLLNDIDAFSKNISVLFSKHSLDWRRQVK